MGAGLLAIMQPASAQVSGQSNQTPGSQSQDQNQNQQSQTQNQESQTQQQNQTIGQRLRQNLLASGFTDIQLMPSSFLVRAKDRDGNPVMMVINPDSITAVTEIGSGNPAGQNRPSTTGQGNANQTNNPSEGQQNNPSQGEQNNPSQSQQNNSPQDQQINSPHK